MTILYNGDVPPCHSCWSENITGNVFNQPLEEIWHKTDVLLEMHINKNYCCASKCANCEKCDEWYTFNF
jgi:radical SAM protein with 4Fe4S-binding SPASM domain